MAHVDSAVVRNCRRPKRGWQANLSKIIKICRDSLEIPRIPAGPPGTDGRTKNSVENTLVYLILIGFSEFFLLALICSQLFLFFPSVFLVFPSFFLSFAQLFLSFPAQCFLSCSQLFLCLFLFVSNVFLCKELLFQFLHGCKGPCRDGELLLIKPGWFNPTFKLTNNKLNK